MKAARLISRSLAVRSISFAGAAMCPAVGASPARGIWSHVPLGPRDPILGIDEAYLADPSSKKANLGIGAYRTDDELPWVFPSVRAAERKILAANLDMELIPIEGNANFSRLFASLALGANSPALTENRTALLQSIGGTGSLRVFADFLHVHGPRTAGGAPPTVYISSETWGNHFSIFKAAGVPTATYRYRDPATNTLAIDAMLQDISAAPKGSVILLHACAHNPTGIDPTPAEWARIVDVVAAGGHTALVDAAYLGFVSGSAETDAAAIHMLQERNVPLVVAQSASKNFGLYGHRTGALSVVCDSTEEMGRVMSQLKIAARSMYSSPHLHGARIVEAVLSDPALKAQWTKDVVTVADRLGSIRKEFVSALAAVGSKRDWSHISKQKGMFAYTGISKDQAVALREKHHVYVTDNGRLAVTGLTTKNVEFVAKAVHEVTK